MEKVLPCIVNAKQETGSVMEQHRLLQIVEKHQIHWQLSKAMFTHAEYKPP